MPYIDAVRMGHNVMAYQIDMPSTYKAKGYLYFYVREVYSIQKSESPKNIFKSWLVLVLTMAMNRKLTSCIGGFVDQI